MSAPAGGPWDKGLQPERTGLAWRRAALAFLGIGLVVPRVAWAELGPWSVLAAAILAVGAVALLAAGHRRYGELHQALRAGRGRMPDGRLPALAAGLALAVGVLALGLALAIARHR